MRERGVRRRRGKIWERIISILIENEMIKVSLGKTKLVLSHT